MNDLNGKKVYLCGVTAVAESAHDYLLGCGCDIVAYCTPDTFITHSRLWNVPIWTEQQAIEHYFNNGKEGVFVLCGMHPLLNDEIRQIFEEGGCGGNILECSDLVPQDHLRKIKNLKDKNTVILIADKIPYEGMKQFWDEQGITMDKVILCSPDNSIDELITQISGDKDAMVMFLLRLAYDDNALFWEKLYDKLNQIGIVNIHTMYSQTNLSFELYLDKCYGKGDFKKKTHSLFSKDYAANTDACRGCRVEIEDVERVLVFHARSTSGTFFMDTILAKHSEILSTGFNYLQNVLLLAVQEVKACDIKVLPKSVVSVINTHCQRVSLNVFEGAEDEFEQELRRVIGSRKVLNEWEIYVAVYIAFFYWKGNTYHGHGKPTILVEMHRVLTLDYLLLRWAEKYFPKVAIFTDFRNPISRTGSSFRLINNDNQFVDKNLVFHTIPEFSDRRKTKEEYVFRFEDAKEYPEQVFGKILSLVGLEWESAMRTGKSSEEFERFVGRCGLDNEFDLKPVYNMYDTYFSPFDKIRLEILFSVEKKLYGYDSLDWRVFGLPLEEIKKWYERPFKIEQFFKFKTEDEKVKFRNKFINRCAYMLDNMERTYDEAVLLENVFIAKRD